MIMNLFNAIREEMKKYPTVIIALFVIMGMYYKTTADVQELNYSVETFKEQATAYTIEAKVEYPLNIVEYGLKDISSDQEVYDQIEIWHNDKWGAQIGALQTICDNAPEKLHSIMTQSTQVNVCRLIK